MSEETVVSKCKGIYQNMPGSSEKTSEKFTKFGRCASRDLNWSLHETNNEISNIVQQIQCFE
jgi:hypothetical protein